MLHVKYAFAFADSLKCLFHIPELAVLLLTAKGGVLVKPRKLVDSRIILRFLMIKSSLSSQK